MTRRDRQGQGGAYRDMEGPYDLLITDRARRDRRRDRQGQEGSDKDKEGCNDLVRTEGVTDKDKEGQKE